ncbi:hypothetical protein J6590_094415 [Homalodisca vitripennis]|nr:hypothetical protein J6590_094415 [Homalodisca vitripennis]
MELLKELNELNASRAEIVIRLEEQVLLVNRASQPQDLRGRRTAPAARSLEKLPASSPHLPHPSAMATWGPILDIGQSYHITPRTTHHGLHALFVNWTRCVDIVCLVRPVHQLIEMTTAIRSDPARWRERGISAVLKPEREGADVE